MQTVSMFKDKHPDVYSYLENNKESNTFFKSLWSQLESKGSLTDKQIACIKKSMNPEKENKPMPYSNKDVLTVKTFLHKKLHESSGLEATSNLITVEECFRETEKAVFISFKFKGCDNVFGPAWLPKSQLALNDTSDEAEGDFLETMGLLNKFGIK